MTSLVPDPEPVEVKQTDRVLYVAERKKRVLSAQLQAVSECGRFVLVFKRAHRCWIGIGDVKAICKGKLKLKPT
jgi:hypothetical protein